MKLLKLAFRKETAVPMVALLFASLCSGALVLARTLWTGNSQYLFLLWNLFLAWLPLVFALFACDHFRAGPARKLQFAGFAAAWLLFFPNAPYIFTDLTHLTARYYAHFWVDLVLILLCAMVGLVLGFLSLFLMQAVVRRLWGGVASWLFIATVAGLSGFGIYLGRFLRFNSWDIVVKPLALWREVGNWAAAPFNHSTTFAFPVLFAGFLFLAYLMLYALTHLQPAPNPPDAA